jgi:hypothetical protein
LQGSLKPECVAPLVLYLCARECPVSGGIYNAAMGYFSRTVLVTSPAIQLGVNGQIPTVEEIQQKWDQIDVVGDQMFNDAVSALFAMTPPEQDEGKGS